jgi:hypothetical protein
MRLVDLRSVVSAVADAVKEPVEQKKLALRLDLEPAVVAGDRSRLQQIVTNLLTNAVQFTPVKGQISVKLAFEGTDHVVLAVQDTGAGIDPAFLPYVFEQFRQGEGGLSRKHGGLGLGLAVVRQLVELHGGFVSVTSPGVGLGATFTVRLPSEKVLQPVGDLTNQPLLLEKLRVTVKADENGDPGAVYGILESSGARVTIEGDEVGSEIPNTGGPALEVRQLKQSGAIAFRQSPSPPEADWQLIPGPAAPADVVRRIARFLQPTS